MKNKTVIIISSFILIATIVINFQSNSEQGSFSGISLNELSQAFAGDPVEEHPHYGSYGTSRFDCSATLSVTGSGTITWMGMDIDYDGTQEIEVSCTNCAWDCNTDGANNTCDPRSCG